MEIPAKIPGMHCPLTGKLMKDPVLLVQSGYSYERSALEARFTTDANFTEPTTGVFLNTPHERSMLPNVALRNLICAWQSARISPATM